MSICRIIETPATPEQYDQMRTRLGVDENNLPPGGKVHIAAKGDDGAIRIVEVWDSREQAEAWGEKVRAVREELGVGGGAEPAITYLEVHSFMTT
jgi:hypothetical protein